VLRRGILLGRFHLPLAGNHNVENALAAIAVAVSAGLSIAEIDRGLKSFLGVARRQTLRAEIRGRDLATGLPRDVTIAGDELRRAIDAPIAKIIDAVRSTLDRCPPELAGDLVARGIVMTGGGALLRGLDARLQHEIGVPFLVADRPLQSVVLGTATVVEHFDQLQKVVVDGPRR
jgi:actin-like ATPase involved in cell morphogenesis